MPFSNSELQQIKALVAENIRYVEEDKAMFKFSIKQVVEKKQPFKQSGQKDVVDRLNNVIRGLYKDVDRADRKLKKLRALQVNVKEEIQHQTAVQRAIARNDQTAVHQRISKIKPLQYLVKENGRDFVTSGFAQVVEPNIVNGQVVSIDVVSPGPGVGWQDHVIEEFVQQPESTIKPDYPPFIPPVRTLELRPEDTEAHWSSPNVGLKPSNPKDVIGSGKLPLHLWPQTATAMGCIGFLNGMLKYGRANFRVHGIRASIYIDAAFRHLSAWFEGEEVDPDDGVPHLAAALACIGIIVDAQAAGKLNDDRQVLGGYRALVASLTPHVARLKALHADKTPKHYTIADNASVV